MATQEELDEVTSERDRLGNRCTALQEEVADLEDRLDRLNVQLRRAENIADENDKTPICDQLESLATDVDRSCAPQTPEQWRRCLRVIAAGGEWEVDGTWR